MRTQPTSLDTNVRNATTHNMAIGGIPSSAPAKSNYTTSSRRRGTAAAAHPGHPRSSSAGTSGTTRDGANPSRPAIAHERHEPNVQQQQPQQSPHAQRQQHSRHQQNRVGKRYRDKLTAGFESLQTALGLDELGSESDAVTGGGGGGEEAPRGDGPVMMGSADGAPRRRRRPLNKARIIDLTCERVRELVGEWEVTRAEMEAMRRERALQGW